MADASAAAPSEASEVQAFDDSRRLTGPNLFFTECGALLDTTLPVDAGREAGWRARLDGLFAALGWPIGPRVVRRHASGTQLAIAAPIDQLFTATSVNEWAWSDALGLPWQPDEDEEGDPGDEVERRAMPRVITEAAAALAWLHQCSAAERNAALVALAQAVTDRALPLLIDDDALSAGSGTGVQTWPIDRLPASHDVDWSGVHAVPTALVTGSNGKTTTARLLSAIAREAGLRPGHCCTDGLYVDGEQIAAGDYSGPAGARAILRNTAVELAVLETARGGILRRGLALARADAAIVTNVSVDHFGEYGIDDLQGLADAKLVVARALVPTRGLLVLNADDAVLAARGEAIDVPIGWFALDDAHPRLVAHRARGGATCGVRDGRMHLAYPERGIDVDLGGVAEMPLSAGGHASYNVSNLLGAALVAAALGLPVAAIRSSLAHFGAARGDNPGRLERWDIAGLRVIVDYAHNPDGLAQLLAVATADAYVRLLVVLGQAGNRADAEIRALAATAVAFRPARVVLKDIAGMERGREPGEAAAVLRDELLRLGVAVEAIDFESREADAARRALASACSGDVVVLPIHGAAAREEVRAMLDGMAKQVAEAAR